MTASAAGFSSSSAVTMWPAPPCFAQSGLRLATMRSAAGTLSRALRHPPDDAERGAGATHIVRDKW